MTISMTTLEAETGGAPSVGVAPPARRQGVWHHLLRNRGAVLALSYIALVALMAVAAPLIVQLSGWGPYEFDQAAIDPNLGGLPVGSLGGISAEHWFGVEPLTGRDLYAIVVYGARTSILVGLSATILAVSIGVLVGSSAALFGGWYDRVISRATDV
ncbi:MAG: ABC transporter permease, partial [Actinomycetes bacterium]